MMIILERLRSITLYIVIVVFFSCQQPGKNSTGSEYIPEMGHSIAYEANYYNYYYYNTWGGQDEYYEFAKPRLPVNGTIPRGYAGGAHPVSDAVAFAPNGSVPYYYGDSDVERVRAANEMINNPYKITDAGLAVGKELYDIYCGICHGEKGDGLGYIVRDDGGKYPVQPANMLLPTFIDTTNGLYYHAIMAGKNKMGDYKDKLSYEERWQVIHYIRSLQAKELKLEYNQLVNTLNDIDEPAGISGDEDAVAADHDGDHDAGEMHEDEDHDSSAHGHSDNDHESSSDH